MVQQNRLFQIALPGYGFVADNSGEPEETLYYHNDHFTGCERKTAKSNGEARKNHKGTPYKTIGPTSIKPKNDINKKKMSRKLFFFIIIFICGCNNKKTIAVR